MKMNTRTLAQILSALILQAALLGVLPHAFAQSGTTDVTIVGPISAASEATLTVNALTVDISQAQIDANLTLAVGEMVQVDGALQVDGSIVADAVFVPQGDLLPDEVEIFGLLTRLDNTTAVVNGLVFDITNATVDPSLLPGTMVAVFTTPDPTVSIWMAREIVPLGLGDGNGSANVDAGMSGTDGHFKFVGTLDAVGDGTMIVSGLTVDTTSARIEGMPLVGALVSVRVQVVDGVLVAVEVDATDGAVFGDFQATYQNRAGYQAQGQGDAVRAECRFRVEVGSANLRGGPGTGYDPLGYALDGDEYAAMAVDASGGWVQVQTRHGTAWVAASVGEMDECAGLPTSDRPFMGEHHDQGHHGDGGHHDGGQGNGGHMMGGEGSAPGAHYNPMDDGPCSSCDGFMGGHDD